MIQNSAAMGNWWLAASWWQHACSYISSCADVFGEASNNPADSAPVQLRFGTLRLLVFLKLKSSLEGKWFQTISEIQENMTGQLMAIPKKDFSKSFEQWKRLWEKCVRPQGAYFEGDWSVIVLCAIYLTPSSVNVSIFHITWLDTSWTDLV